MSNQKSDKGKSRVGSDGVFDGVGPFQRIADVLEIKHAKTVDEVIEHAAWLVDSYKSLCNRLRVTAERYNPGLGGEKHDVLVCEKLKQAMSAMEQIHREAKKIYDATAELPNCGDIADIAAEVLKSNAQARHGEQ